MPIAQNILTINNETLYEEMESFFHRAILCLYNTLFVVKVNDSSSDYQKRYIHFPLGGNITKQKIFNDLEKRLEIIKKEKNKNISIHLDLFPISDNSISILNDF